MWRIARLALVVAMLIAADGTPGEPGTGGLPRLVPLARIDGWALTSAISQPSSRVVVAYDAAAARKVWTTTHAARRARRTASAPEYGVYAGLDTVDFSRQVVLVLESAGSSSCPNSLLDVRPRPAGGVDLVTSTYRPEEFCTADLHAFTEIVAVDRDLLPPASALGSPTVLVDGARIGAVHVATAS
jgi:hypothetical protein